MPTVGILLLLGPESLKGLARPGTDRENVKGNGMMVALDGVFKARSPDAFPNFHEQPRPCDLLYSTASLSISLALTRRSVQNHFDQFAYVG